MSKISVVINTYNEENNIANVIGSVEDWTDEIIVVDMHSSDRTATIALSMGAKVFLHENLGYADPARAFAIAKSSHDWILMLDADEMVPYELSKILKMIMESGDFDAVNIPWINYLFGKHIENTGWGGHQDKHIRFFKKGYVIADSRIHNFLHPIHTARVLDLKLDKNLGIVHFNYKDLNHFVEKMNRYTSIEASKLKSDDKIFLSRLIIVPLMEFFKRLLYRKGYKDGIYGFILSVFMMFYKFLSYAKAYENTMIKNFGNSDKTYKVIASEILKEYENQKV